MHLQAAIWCHASLIAREATKLREQGDPEEVLMQRRCLSLVKARPGSLVPVPGVCDVPFHQTLPFLVLRRFTSHLISPVLMVRDSFLPSG